MNRLIQGLLRLLTGKRLPSKESQTPVPPPAVYHQDGLWTIHNHAFMDSPSFRLAYERGVQAAGTDYRWHWRVHVGLWAASHAAHLPGDFVECGVNRGFMSSAIMAYLDWDTLGRRFYLLDTFAGLDERYVSDRERQAGILDKAQVLLASGMYVSGADSVRANFTQWRNTCIVEGPIPDTLPQVESERIAFLHIDMNCAPPEVAAAEYFWDRLVPGAPILLDDYAYHGYEHQKIAMDDFATRHGVAILSLPTGQGLILRPGDGA